MTEPTEKPKTYVVCANCGRGHDGSCAQPARLPSAVELVDMLEESVGLTDEALRKLHAARAERDALAAELAELRAAAGEVIAAIDDQGQHCAHATVNQIRHCARCGRVPEAWQRLEEGLSQPQGERGKALLAVVEAVEPLRGLDPNSSSDMEEAALYVPGILTALAAIDGVQAERVLGSAIAGEISAEQREAERALFSGEDHL